MSLIYNATFDSQTRVLSLLDRAGNVISSCEVPSKSNVDDITKPLTFRATQDGSTVRLFPGYHSPGGAFQTSRDGGNTWVDYTIDTTITLNTGDELSFRAKTDRSAQSMGAYFKFSMGGKIEAWHNVMSLYRTNDFATYNTVRQYAFTYLFEGCTSLTKAPILPATTLANNCYERMFDGCTSLTNAPVLPATTLADRCYGFMFRGCSNLNEVRCQMPSSYSSSQISSYADTWLSDVSSTGTFYTNADAKWSSGASGIPTGWTRRNIDLLNALTLTATADNSSVKLTKNGTLDNTFEVDTGNGWTAYEFDTVIPLNAGQSCKWRCSAHPTTRNDINYVRFVMTGTIEASGNCNSMLSSDFENLTSLAGYNYAFYQLFNGCSSLTKAPILPATTLASYCYFSMFWKCTSLTSTPQLPATTLANYCYHGMFIGCSKLKEVRIAATTTATNALKSWLNGVSATGDFYCDPNATIFPTGTSGIPMGWTRHALSDYPATP